jgi:alpha-glucosidase (family GH31 glycosyl hydrolase)
MLARAAAVVLAAFPLSAEASAEILVRSGPLVARVDGAGALHFAQRGGAPLAGGTPSFRVAGRWRRATHLLSARRIGRAAVVVLGTRGAGPVRVALRARADGVIAVRAAPRAGGATAAAIEFRAPAGERYFGFGERSNAVAQRGTVVENYVSDGPFSPESRAIAAAVVPPAGFRPRADATYYPVPWLLSGRGYGVLIANHETSRFRLPGAGGRSWRASVAAPQLDLRLFAGPTPARALRRFTAATGRQPPPAAPWAFGPWLQTGQPNAPPLADQFGDLEKLRAADAPVSAAETQLRYLPCGLDRGLEGYEAERVAHYHRNGLAVLTYVNPMLCVSYEPRYSRARAAGALLRTAGGEPALFNSFVGGTGAAGFTIQPVAQYDFTSSAGSAAYREVIDRMLAVPHEGWMEDFGEYTPLDARAASGLTGSALHNRYPALYHCAVHRLTAGRPIVRFQRSGWTGAARCAIDVWGGDPTTTFGFDGLSSAVKQALSMGLSGVSRWGSDIGGYDTIGGDPRLTPELLKRWIAFGAVSGVMRIKKSGLEIPAYTRPQVWDPDVIGVWRKFTKLHTQLYPYILAADRKYRRTGLPLMRALVLDYPRDRRAAAAEDEFLFGDDLLAAPVITAGARSRSVYLPRGRWLDARGALAYDERDGAFHVRPAGVLRGRRTVTARARLDELPLYVRAGAVIPMLPADVFTLSDFGGGEVVRLADRRDRMRLLAFPATRGGRWTVAVVGDRRRRYTLEAAFRACAVALDGRPLPRSAWRVRRGVLTATFSARRARLTARGC